MIKERFSELGYVLWGVFLVVLVFSIIMVASMAWNGTMYPWWLSIQRKSVEQSKSFTDSNNNMLQAYMLEYSRLDTKIAEVGEDSPVADAYESQQKAIKEKMCLQVSTMSAETVNPQVISFLNSQRGCK